MPIRSSSRRRASRTAGPPSNLPNQFSSFVGRERELADVHARVAEARLVTLVGAGGVGKTRLALRAADQVGASFPDGRWLVELAPLAEPGLVARSVALALGVRVRHPTSAVDALASSLAEQHALLILDNCEHLLHACGALVHALLRRGEHLRVIATSREPLGLPGEVVWRVPPLATTEAVRLFTERTAAVQADFLLTDRNVGTVTDICRRLDGIPLAIELAAARVPALGVRGVMDRLADRFRLLDGGDRSPISRQQTIRATLDWSYRLLNERQRALLDRLSVFSGACDLEAIERACGDSDDVADGLAQLVGRSLVVAEPQADWTMRYRLLESVKAYAEECFERRGAAPGTRRRHAEYFLELAERAAPELRRTGQSTWLARLDRDHDNLRAALDWCIEQHEAQLGLRLGAALARFWYVRGYLDEGLHQLERLLAMPTSAGDAAIRVAVLNGAGNLAWTLGDLDRAETFLNEALELARQLGEEHGQASTLYELSKVASDRKQSAEALRLAEQARAAWQRQHDTWGIAVALNMLGELMRETGDLAQARQLYEHSLRLFIEVDDARGRAIATHNLAILAASRDDLRTAVDLQRSILPLKLELGDREGIVCSLIDLAQLGLRRTERALAALLCGAAEAERARIKAILPAHERGVYAATVAAARQAMGDAAFDAAFSTGANMDLAAAVAAAMAPALERSAAASAELTRRELEVLGLVAAGKSNREIAKELVVSVRTVERHIENIYQKVGATGRVSRAIATAYAFTHSAVAAPNTS